MAVEGGQGPELAVIPEILYCEKPTFRSTKRTLFINKKAVAQFDLPDTCLASDIRENTAKLAKLFDRNAPVMPMARLSQSSGWHIELTVTDGFGRVPPREARTSGELSSIRK